MKKNFSYAFAIFAFAFVFSACSKDQQTVKCLDGRWQVTAERVSENGGPFITTPTADLGDIKYEFTKCKQKKEGLCDGNISAVFGMLSFEVPFGFKADDKGETLFIDEDKNEATTEDQRTATITTLEKNDFSFTYTETDGSDTETYQYDLTRIED
jgi:hypothetical protein